MTRINYIDGGGPIEVEYLHLSSHPSPGNYVSSPLLLEDIDFGEPNSSLKIVLAVHFYRGAADAPASLSSVTIGGVAGSIMAAPVITSDAGAWMGAAIVAAKVPGGGIGDIELTFTHSIVCKVAVFRVINAISLDAIDPDGDPFGFTSSNSRSVDSDVPAGGVIFGAGTIFHNGGANTFSGVTPAYHAYIHDGNTNIIHIASGFEVIPAGQAGKAFTFTKSGGADSMSGAMVAVSFR